MVYSVSISEDGKNYRSVFNGIAASIQVAELPPNKSVSVSEDGNNYRSVFNGIAASIQVADLEKKGNMTLYVSKDGTAFQPNPIYNVATNYYINFPVTGSGNKVVYVSTDGASFQPNPIYNDAAKNFFFQLAPVTQPGIQLPNDGRPQPEKNANKDAKTWKTAQMTDDPALWKVVDDKNINVADQFHSQANAQQYIDYYKSTYQKSDTTGTLGRTSGGQIVEDGIKMFYPKIEDAQTFAFKSSNDGRSQYVCKLKKPLINMEVTGIIDLKKVDNPKEEVSIKTRGGRHSDDKEEDKPKGCCYISGVKYNGKINSQWECPHPNNTPMPLHEKEGNFSPGSVVGKKFGIKNIVYYDQAQDKDVIMVYLDMNLDNNWKLFYQTTSTKFKNKENSKGEPMVFFRMDDIPGAPESDENAKLTKGTVREISLHQ
jgi:hypothetical protein